MKIFGIKNCDKVKKTILWCAQNMRMCEFHDYRVDGLDDELLSSFLQQHSFDKLINKRSTTWRNLTDDDKANPSKDLVISNPTLLKRPIVVINDEVHIGYFPDFWQ